MLQKKLRARKRYSLVDIQGLLLRAIVQPAQVIDRDDVRGLLPSVLTRKQFPHF